MKKLYTFYTNALKPLCYMDFSCRDFKINSLHEKLQKPLYPAPRAGCGSFTLVWKISTQIYTCVRKCRGFSKTLYRDSLQGKNTVKPAPCAGLRRFPCRFFLFCVEVCTDSGQLLTHTRIYIKIKNYASVLTVRIRFCRPYGRTGVRRALSG